MGMLFVTVMMFYARGRNVLLGTRSGAALIQNSFEFPVNLITVGETELHLDSTCTMICSGKFSFLDKINTGCPIKML